MSARLLCGHQQRSPFRDGIGHYASQKGAQLFEAHARVVYSRASKGMGLVFTDMSRDSLGFWKLGCRVRETSWLAATAEGRQRVLMTIPAASLGKDRRGKSLLKRRRTAGHQCSRRFDSRVDTGVQRTAATLSKHPDRSATGVCSCPYRRRKGEQPQAGVEFTAAQSYVLASGLSAKRTGRPVTQMQNPT